MDLDACFGPSHKALYIARRPRENGRMRCRPSARLLLFDEQGNLLLFRYAGSEEGPGSPGYWSTPGRALEAGESFEQAARHELLEETGLAVEQVGESVAEREFVLKLTTGESVLAQERYFAVRVQRQEISNAGWTELEKVEMLGHRWWPQDELSNAQVTIYPENLASLVNRVWPHGVA